MSQHDMVIDNGSGSAVRADINAALQALIGLSSGATGPATTYAYMLWADTTSGLLKVRNAGNSAWIVIGTLANAFLDLVSLGTGQTITAQHTIAPVADQAPLVLGEHAQDQLVAGLYADRSNTAILGDAKDLIVKVNATHPDHQVDIDATELVLKDSSGNVHLATDVDLTIDLAVSGANGLDTGSPDNVWYDIGAIYNPTTAALAGLAWANGGAPSLPSGYTHWARASFAKRTAGSLLPFQHVDDEYLFTTLTKVVNDGITANTSSVDLSAAVPPGIKGVRGKIMANGSSMTFHYHIVTFGNSQTQDNTATLSLWLGGNTVTAMWHLPLLVEDQTMYVQIDAGTADLWVAGFTLRR